MSPIYIPLFILLTQPRTHTYHTHFDYAGVAVVVDGGEGEVDLW